MQLTKTDLLAAYERAKSKALAANAHRAHGDYVSGGACCALGFFGRELRPYATNDAIAYIVADIWPSTPAFGGIIAKVIQEWDDGHYAASFDALHDAIAALPDAESWSVEV